jgi:hypothetical protein
MQRWHDGLAVLATGFSAAFYLAALIVVLYAGMGAVSVLHEISTDLKQQRILHDQMLKDHRDELKDHERIMQSR